MNFRTVTQINTLENRNLSCLDLLLLNKIKLTVPERISCGQQLNKNGRQTRRSSYDILDLAEPVICLSDQNCIWIEQGYFLNKIPIKRSDTYLTSSDTYPLCYGESFIGSEDNAKNMKISKIGYQFNVIDYRFYSHRGATSRLFLFYILTRFPS